MRDDNRAAELEVGLRTHPLCCRYLAVFIDSLQTQVHNTAGVRLHLALAALRDGECEVLGTWRSWGPGMAHWQAAFEDLQSRGVETIRFVVCGDSVAVQDACRPAYPDATVLPSPALAVERSLAQVAPRHREAVAGALRAFVLAGSFDAARAALDDFAAGRWGQAYPALSALWRCALAELEPLFGLPLPRRRVVLEGDGAVQRLHQRLVRAVDRHGVFSDAGAAESFVAAALARWEHGPRRTRSRAAAAADRYHRRTGIDRRIGALGC